MRFAVTVVALAALVVPVVRDSDSFPLSTHPMYASVREPIEVLPSAVGVDVEGARHRLSLRLIARTDDPLIAQSFLWEAIRADRAGDVCRDISARLGSESAFDHVVRVEVVTETIELIELVSGDGGLVDRSVHADCEVDR